MQFIDLDIISSKAIQRVDRDELGIILHLNNEDDEVSQIYLSEQELLYLLEQITLLKK